MQSLSKKLIFSFFIFVLCLLILEVGSWGALKHLSLASNSYKDLYQSLSEFKLSDLETTLDWKKGIKRNPLFGFTLKAGNNYGFANPEPFPRQKKSDEYVIGVLGGSVAFSFAAHLQNSSEFNNTLKKNIPDLSKKKIIILNLAVPGYRQPQQFHVFSYFKESLDAIIELDGWNEVWVSGSPAYPVDFPAFTEVFYSDDLRVQQEQIRIAQLKNTLQDASLFLQAHPWLMQSSSIYLLMYSLRNYTLAKGGSMTRLNKSFGIEENFYGAPLDDTRETQIRSDSWVKYLRMTDLVARSSGIRRFYFVQPSQYVEGVKILSPHETKEMVTPHFAPAARRFSEIRSRARQLQKELPLWDLNSSVFKNETREIFVDQCCHVNLLGNELMEQNIVQIMSRFWKDQSLQ